MCSSDLSVEASGALSKLTVIAVVLLTQVALLAGVTELTVSGEVSGEEPVGVVETGLLTGDPLQPLNARDAKKPANENTMRQRRHIETS